MLSFSKTLDILVRSGLSVTDINVAMACNDYIEYEYNEHEFELLCALIKEVYLCDSIINAETIASTVNNLMINCNYTLDEVLSLSKHDILDKCFNEIK